jgi:hypothetical protein
MSDTAPQTAGGKVPLELGLVDEIDLHIAPVPLGEGIRLYDNPGHRHALSREVHPGRPGTR